MISSIRALVAEAIPLASRPGSSSTASDTASVPWVASGLLHRLIQPHQLPGTTRRPGRSTRCPAPAKPPARWS